ncbi:MAG: prolyl oligopeptidase family serine peptidase [Myxococcales bacterium]|nr:prolyl oligopeptidase family serine peptidase [Myxococcales bacterium]
MGIRLEVFVLVGGLGLFLGCGDAGGEGGAGGDASGQGATGTGGAAPTSTTSTTSTGGGAGGGTVEPDPSPGCAMASPYPGGTTTEDMLVHDDLERTFRVHLPPAYEDGTPAPLVLMLHGGGGSGRQLEEDSSKMSEVADREGFIAVYPDGTGTLRTWNGGGCCGSAVTNEIDDVGFVAALLDQLEATICVDRRRIYASGMSNGGILSHRLACELPSRFAAVAPVAGAEMAPTCTPSEPVALMHIHGTADGHVPPEGGFGCGPANVSFPPLADTLERRRLINGCEESPSPTFTAGDGTCSAYDGCAADVVLCLIQGGGHSWPGGEPNADVIECPEDGPQSTTFSASEEVWRFFAEHPKPGPG